MKAVEAAPARGVKRAVFLAVMLLTPLFLLGALELGLRAAGIGQREPLFIPHPSHPEWSLANPRAVERLFAHPSQAPKISIETGFFRTRKNPGALRLVVQGGSSAAGFPYGYGASLAGMLEQRLRREFPEREIEVVTTAMSAVNSWALLEFAPEIIALEPDAVLIYAGHNEFLGILGVGSAYTVAGSASLTRLVMRLRHLRSYRLLETTLARAVPAGAAPEEGALMARVAAERRIALDSPLFAAGTRQFEQNLHALLARYRAAGVPVFIATLVSNERGQPPFDSEEPVEARKALQAALGQREAGELSAGLAALEVLAAQNPGSALIAFHLAEALAESGRTAEAQAAWRQARDLDLLRFRAPGQFNTLLATSAREHGATLVDVEAAFRARAPHGAIGNELLLEHLHPNAEGYFVLAASFHHALLQAGLPGAAARAVEEEVARAEIPLSAVDQRFGEYKLIRLMNDWPFTVPARPTVLPPPRGIEEELAQAMYRRELDWAQAHDRLKRHYRVQGRPEEHLRVALILADAFPFLPQPQREAAEALLAAGRQVQALRYLYATLAYAPEDAIALRLFASTAAGLGLGQEAARARERLERLESRQRR
jgi:tetratricopeptide (TPR) repeat protein